MNVTLFFHVWTATHILQFSSGTVPLNFFWLSRNALSLTTNLLVSFYFVHYPCFVWTTTPFCLFFWVELSHFSLCECHTNILVFPLLLSGQSTFVSFWVITDPFLFLSCVDCHASFLKWKLHLCYLTSFLSFGNITNLFITTSHISNVIIHLQLLALFLSVFTIHQWEQFWC